MGVLKLGKPIGVSAGTKKTHEYGNSVRSHYGIDYPARIGTSVVASEMGAVIRAADNTAGGYGNVTIIDHTPGAKWNERHIYTLYAHLDKFAASYGNKVVKGQKIGECGETGNASGSHLHFEVISSSSKMKWGKTGATGFHKSVNRVNPSGYFGYPHKVNGTLTDMVEQAIVDRMEAVSDIDFSRNVPFRIQVWLDGRNLGDMEHLVSIITNLNYDLKSELRRLH